MIAVPQLILGCGAWSTKKISLFENDTLATLHLGLSSVVITVKVMMN